METIENWRIHIEDRKQDFINLLIKDCEKSGIIFAGFGRGVITLKCRRSKDFFKDLSYLKIFLRFMTFFWDLLHKCTIFFQVIYPSVLVKNLLLNGWRQQANFEKNTAGDCG